jgi:sulfur carrier protein ThiS
VKLHFGGHLSWYLTQKDANLDVPLEGPTRLTDLLEMLNIPAGEVMLTVINGEVVDLSTATVIDTDRVALYPPIGGGA